jgi:hypothetical protein
MSKLEEIYEFRSKHGNVHEHMITFNEYASKVNHVTEFGFGGGWSAAGFLMGKPKKFITYDINLSGRANEYKEMVKDDTEFIAIEADTAEIEIEPTELLYIDSLHTYTHLKKELEIHSNKVEKWIMLHDTATFGARGEDKNYPGLKQAIEEFVALHPEWVIKEIRMNCHGLTILERINGQV